MKRRGQGSLAQTLVFSFVYGAFVLAFLVKHSSAAPAYDKDFLSFWLIAPLGAFCGFVLSSWVHELAHFFAARLVGFHVRALFIGSGYTLLRFTFLGTPCVVCESLRSGAVVYLATSTRHARRKMLLVTAAAPVASLLLAAGVVWLAVAAFPNPESATSQIHYTFAFVVGMAAPCLLFLPGILIPYRYVYKGRSIQSDAMSVLTVPWRTDAEIEKQVEAAQSLLSTEIDPTVLSREEAEARVNAAPNDRLALRTAIMFQRQSFDPKVLDYYRKLVPLSKNPKERMEYLDQFLTYCLEGNCVSPNGAEMDTLSKELLASDPNNLSLRGTRGGVLVDLGRNDEGSAILKDVLERSQNPVDQVYSSIFMALATKAQEDIETARQYALHALKVDAECPALRRVADLLPPSERRS